MSDTPIRQTDQPNQEPDKPALELENQGKGANVEDHVRDRRVVDPRDIVYKDGTPENPREVIENPAVAPQMIEDVQDREF